ncbi:MAG: metal ABC transporter substrate-binding protein [Ruminococcus sp.]|nr:metal ABC transporter substrate-binding protein [Ruminococcus sp.]
MHKYKFIPLLFCTLLFISCGSANINTENEKIKIVCAAFPEYDWTREIAKNTDNTEIILIADNGTDLHSFQPSTKDIVNILSCDVLIYIGGESDKWIDDTIENSADIGDIHIVKLSDILEERLLHEPDIHESTHEHNHEHNEDEAFDEHIWLSLKNASILCNGIAKALSDADDKNTDIYTVNAAHYIENLDSLDNDFEKKLLHAKRKNVLFADRFPFIYMMEDYNITYHAAFPGCSAEADASFETILSLSLEADNEDLHTILTIEGSDCNISDAVIKNTRKKDQNVLNLDSMQAVKRSDIENGKTYISVMKKNLDMIMEALN